MVVEPLLAGGDDLGEDGWLEPVGAQRPTSIRQSQNLQKQSLPQFQASQQSKSRLRWPLPRLSLIQNVQKLSSKMTRLFNQSKFNVSSVKIQEQERDYQLTVLGPCFSGQGDTI